MGVIQVLDEQLANRIAAGEVVERPASVVKELAENAIDAGATAIDIAVEEGGLASIRVRDNGAGIAADDLETAFQRHATSKIRTDRDLLRIASLGFRGEALPSIAAVSRVTCLSCADGSGLGRKITLEGGGIRSVEQAAAPQGTEIIVRDLFFNTPARLKYMKTIQTELGHVSDCVNRLALAHPEIAFTLTHNGNTLLRTTGGGDRLQVIAAIYGTSAARQMLPAAGETADYRLTGYLSKPELTRANRAGMTTIVNGRYIRSFVLNQAILEAYHTLLPVGRYPLVVLEIGMHPGLVDVNVHPAKMEVRFSKEPELRKFIESALREALGRAAHIPAAPEAKPRQAVVQERLQFGPAVPRERHAGGAGRPPGHAAGSDSPVERAAGTGGRPADRAAGRDGYAAARGGREAPVPRDAAERLYAPPGAKAADAQAAREAAAAREYAAGRTASGPVTEIYAAAAPSSAAEQSAGGLDSAAPPENAADSASRDAGRGFPELSWIGQLHGTYIVAQSEDGLYLIDQHAAHERINYEYYLRKYADPPQVSQPLIVPLTLEFTPGEAETIRGRLDAFAAAGVELEPFGGSAFLVRACPEWLPQGREREIIEEMAEWILAEKKTIDIGKLRERAAIMTACKASIKANDRMTREEGEALLARLAACGQPYTCPHGRPILVHFSTYQLEKMFKRVMP